MQPRTCTSLKSHDFFMMHVSSDISNALDFADPEGFEPPEDVSWPPLSSCSNIKVIFAENEGFEPSEQLSSPTV